MTKTNEEYFCDLVGKLNKGEIKFETYLKERGITNSGRLPRLYEFKTILKSNPSMFNLFLGIVSIGVRCMVMKEVFELDERQLLEVLQLIKPRTVESRSTINNFIKENLTIKNIYENSSSRNFSYMMIINLSIIFDIPVRFLADPNAEFIMNNAFDEYARDSIEEKTLKQLYDDVQKELNEGLLFNRRIFGVKIFNKYFREEPALLYTRVDIRKEFFIIEMHLANNTIVNSKSINKIKNELNFEFEFYYCDSFMRDSKKLSILISINKSKKHNVPHLIKNNLLENTIFFDDWR